MQPCPVGKVQLRKLTLSQPCMSMRLSLIFLPCSFKGAVKLTASIVYCLYRILPLSASASIVYCLYRILPLTYIHKCSVGICSWGFPVGV